MDCVILSTQAWDEMGGAGRPTHYLARELLARGERVLYIEAQPSHTRAGTPRLTVRSLSQLGFDERALRRAWHGLEPSGLREFASAFARALEAFEEPGATARLALWADPFIPFVLLWPALRSRGYYTVYECLDDFEALADLGYYFESRTAESLLLQECDLTVVVSKTLLEKLSARTPGATLRLLRQGFDPADFQRRGALPPPPPDLVRGERTLGFWGLVNDFNVDPALIAYVARAQPAWAINLIGPVDPEPSRPPVAELLRAQPNVHLLGLKPHDRLKDYLEWFDVTLIPYPPNAFNRGRDPLKVFEYLAGYRPVVAAHTPQLAGMPYVYLGDAPVDFLAQIGTALRIPVERAEIDAYLKDCTWSARLDTLLAWVRETPRRAGSPPTPTADLYPRVELPANLRAYVAHAEQLLDERTAYIAHLEREWERSRAYRQRLERTHPGIWLRAAAHALGSRPKGREG